jgi:hypothetical protein
MNVLLSQPKSSQNGMVDATGYGNIIWNYDLEHDPAKFLQSVKSASQLGAGKLTTGERQ